MKRRLRPNKRRHSFASRNEAKDDFVFELWRAIGSRGESMNIALLGEQIFDALQTFDGMSAPFGLYAAGDLAGEEPQRRRKGFTSQKEE